MTTEKQPSLKLQGTHKPVERFELRNSGRKVVRLVKDSTGQQRETSMPVLGDSIDHGDLASLFEREWLRSPIPPYRWSRPDVAAVNIVDLFSGCGGMTLGVKEACRAIAKHAAPIFAADHKEEALQVFKKNFPEAITCGDPLEQLLDGIVGSDPTPKERDGLFQPIGGRPIDFLVGGPPCQGHSNLNNHTRRADPKNSLMNRMVRCAELLTPKHIIIENVPQAKHDRNGIVTETMDGLKDLGYNTVKKEVVNLSHFGVPQKRRRLVIVATRNQPHDFMFGRIDAFHQTTRDLHWAIGDLDESDEKNSIEDVEKKLIFDTANEPSEDNQQRIDYLFKENKYDLPNEKRPRCHQNGTTYKAVYGRLKYYEPAPTITTGFGCIGQGRYIHPTCPRSLTPHEAARIQYFPDWFQFGENPTRSALHRLIGNAVPWKLTYAMALLLLTTPEQ